MWLRVAERRCAAVIVVPVYLLRAIMTRTVFCQYPSMCACVCVCAFVCVCLDADYRCCAAYSAVPLLLSSRRGVCACVCLYVLGIESTVRLFMAFPSFHHSLDRHDSWRRLDAA